MQTTNDPRIDDYIEKSAEFAKPILHYIRALIHRAHPEIRETIKWGMPNFEYRGLLCHMAAFKQHCALGFYKGSLLADPYQLLKTKEGMGHFGKITRMEDLPPEDILIQYIKNAVQLNESGVKIQKKKAQLPNGDLPVPSDLLAALEMNQLAKDCFANFSYSHRKEYIEWIAEAKTEATRQKRLNMTVKWLEEGKSRNWKYKLKERH